VDKGHDIGRAGFPEGGKTGKKQLHSTVDSWNEAIFSKLAIFLFWQWLL
jgi:hypothetical protein